MGPFHENASFGSHDKPLLVCHGLLTTYEKPTMNSYFEFIVATADSLIGSDTPTGRMNHFYDTATARKLSSQAS